MELNRLLDEVVAHMPDAAPAEAFRMAMLLCHSAPDLESLADAPLRERLLQDLQMQLAMHEDQHAAIASELDSLASTEPCQFHVNHLWTLIRAIKVQSQLLTFYLGPQPLATS
ncbi:MAG: hypothetical protein IT423_06810 [Pirellulaceae bacterium]|nr:hypothetical protein [Pirellulaceae bacterium]